MIPNPWVLLGAGLAWLASLVAVGWWQRSDGAEAERSANRGVQIEELKVAGKKILDLEEKNRSLEAAHAVDLANIGAAYEDKLQQADARRRADVAAARAGAIKLRVPGITCPVRPDGGSAAETPATPGQRDDPPAAELPTEIAANLFELVDDADRVTEQLAACQAVVLSDRKPQ